MATGSSFLGTGWGFPPQFNRETAQVAMVSDEDDIAQSLNIILSTYPGERFMQPTFGCELSQFLFEEVRQGVITSIRGIVADALLYHEPRIKVDRIAIAESETEPGLLLINIDYTIRSTNSRFNFVYPFYLNEAVS
ncbi:GPW/gp25 family protein [Leptothoe spongobia]|uniref:GPW/gp25 family protein n=1 Tax=Leptothoe spongobia TAU-MAC 1115 TaxID=1967444 RepID=A0A947DCF0_9CYAN|nr:GPW/gp25 family protein [Leptothoe spongobia]MBT9314477.1 GPW/gp25 family protein [Leptothoe spongobia TAU-MAC 1115]